MLKHQLTTVQWLELPIEIRGKLREIFNIPKSTGAQILNKTVVSDGFTHQDLSVVTVEAMQAFLRSDVDDFWKLMEMTLKRVYEMRDTDLKVQIAEAKEEKEKLSESKAEALADLAREMESIAKSAEATFAKKRGRPRKV